MEIIPIYRDYPDISVETLLSDEQIFGSSFTLADLGSVPDAPPPPWDPILSFSHTILAKSPRIRDPRPPTGNPGSAMSSIRLIHMFDT